MSISLEDAYNVQAASFQRRLARGEKHVGMKMGFTSRAKMIQMGLSVLVWGRLSDEMLVEDGDDINFNKLTLFDIEGNVIEVNSWFECAHYVNGGWSPTFSSFFPVSFC